jgi:hypothetical protein
VALGQVAYIFGFPWKMYSLQDQKAPSVKTSENRKGKTGEWDDHRNYEKLHLFSGM